MSEERKSTMFSEAEQMDQFADVSDQDLLVEVLASIRAINESAVRSSWGKKNMFDKHVLPMLQALRSRKNYTLKDELYLLNRINPLMPRNVSFQVDQNGFQFNYWKPSN